MTVTPNVVLLSAGTPPQSALLDSLPNLTSGSSQVDLIVRKAPEPWMADLGVDVTSLVTGLRYAAGSAGSAGSELLQQGRRAHKLRLLAASRADASLQTWLLIRWNTAVAQKFQTADLVVALDQAAVYSLWKVAQTREDGDFVLGLTEATLRYEKILERTSPTR
jgi:hypothetical protein